MRAVAVLSVVLHHADRRLLPGGFTGVDVFFVISGFLITRILLSELRAGTFSLAEFYRRRVRRLFPALFLVLVCTLAAGAVLLPPAEYRELAGTAVATSVFVSNVQFVRISDYFGGAAELKPLLHTWSLAVEEQFYLLFPPILAFVVRRTRHARLILGCCFVASLAASEWAVRREPVFAFFLSPFRAFELLIGASLATARLPESTSRRVRDGLSLTGILLIAIAAIAFDESTPFPGIRALVPCFGAAAIILSGADSHESLGGRLISSKPFVFIGGISYSLYLWHWPILVFARHYAQDELTKPLVILSVLAAFVAATLSWRYVERPILSPKSAKLPALKLGVVTIGVFASAAFAIVLAKGWPSRFGPETLRLFASANDYNPRRATCHDNDLTRMPYEKLCVFGADGAEPDTVIWGDSHGAELVVALGEVLSKEHRAAIELTFSACPPALDYVSSTYPACSKHNTAVFRHLTADSRIRVVMLSANFAGYAPADADPIRLGYARTVAGLRASGKQVVLVYPIPTFRADPPVALGLRASRGQALTEYGLPYAKYLEANRAWIEMLDALRESTHSTAIRPADVLCTQGLCRAFDDRYGVLYFNWSHLSVTGARLVLEKTM